VKYEERATEDKCGAETVIYLLFSVKICWQYRLCDEL